MPKLTRLPAGVSPSCVALPSQFGTLPAIWCRPGAAYADGVMAVTVATLVATANPTITMRRRDGGLPIRCLPWAGNSDFRGTANSAPHPRVNGHGAHLPSNYMPVGYRRG